MERIARPLPGRSGRRRRPDGAAPRARRGPDARRPADGRRRARTASTGSRAARQLRAAPAHRVAPRRRGAGRVRPARRHGRARVLPDPAESSPVRSARLGRRVRTPGPTSSAPPASQAVLAALVVLAARAERRLAARFTLGDSSASPDALSLTAVTAESVLRLLHAPHRRPARARERARRRHLGRARGPPALGGCMDRRREAARGASGGTPRWRSTTCSTRSGARSPRSRACCSASPRSVELGLPEPKACVRLLGDPFGGDGRPRAPAGASARAGLEPGLRRERGQSSFSRSATGEIIAYPIPNSPRDEGGRPKRYRSRAGGVVAAVGWVQRGLVMLTVTAGEIVLEHTNPRGPEMLRCTFARAGALPVAASEPGDPLAPLVYRAQEGPDVLFLDARRALFRLFEQRHAGHGPAGGPPPAQEPRARRLRGGRAPRRRRHTWCSIGRGRWIPVDEQETPRMGLLDLLGVGPRPRPALSTWSSCAATAEPSTKEVIVGTGTFEARTGEQRRRRPASTATPGRCSRRRTGIAHRAHAARRVARRGRAAGREPRGGAELLLIEADQRTLSLAGRATSRSLQRATAPIVDVALHPWRARSSRTSRRRGEVVVHSSLYTDTPLARFLPEGLTGTVNARIVPPTAARQPGRCHRGGSSCRPRFVEYAVATGGSRTRSAAATPAARAAHGTGRRAESGGLIRDVTKTKASPLPEAEQSGACPERAGALDVRGQAARGKRCRPARHPVERHQGQAFRRARDRRPRGLPTASARRPSSRRSAGQLKPAASLSPAALPGRPSGAPLARFLALCEAGPLDPAPRVRGLASSVARRADALLAPKWEGHAAAARKTGLSAGRSETIAGCRCTPRLDAGTTGDGALLYDVEADLGVLGDLGPLDVLEALSAKLVALDWPIDGHEGLHADLAKRRGCSTPGRRPRARRGARAHHVARTAAPLARAPRRVTPPLDARAPGCARVSPGRGDPPVAGVSGGALRADRPARRRSRLARPRARDPGRSVGRRDRQRRRRHAPPGGARVGARSPGRVRRGDGDARRARSRRSLVGAPPALAAGFEPCPPGQR